MFLAVSPPAYIGVGLLKMSAIIPHYSYFAKYPHMIMPVQTISFIAAVFLWMFAFSLCSLAFVATFAGIQNMRFHLTWYSMVFPNCGLGIALLGIGAILEYRPIQWVGTAATIVITVLWLVVNIFHIEALWRGSCLIVLD
jgi:tellurite resistance protein TehA-like permease